ncbi:MAG: helix-turn-helix domain-containing protein [Lachnospiraceae bacterium]|nr:helix-turn-helix domain-containing protein [Lachnospiraceae bacterium]
MKTKLTIQEKLKDLRVDRSLTLEQLAAETKISKTALSSYETDELKDIPHTVIAKLAEYYGVPTDYLLGLTENIKCHSLGIQELKIDDAMAELLQSGHINNRLFCELATHPAFSKLMTDLEIYVDDLINLQIQTINSALDAVRQRLSEQFHPDNDDYYIKLLDASHIEDDDYFLNIIQNDLKAVISDIRAHHRKDTENATDINITDKINETFDDINNYNGNLIDLLMYYFCKEIHLPLSSLSSEEIQTMRALFQRSGRYKSEARLFRKGRKK